MLRAAGLPQGSVDMPAPLARTPHLQEHWGGLTDRLRDCGGTYAKGSTSLPGQAGVRRQTGMNVLPSGG